MTGVTLCAELGHLYESRLTVRKRSDRKESADTRVIEDQITTLRPYNARYTGDHRSIFRKRYTEMITVYHSICN
jgi:trans-aconitate methyltransferase